MAGFGAAVEAMANMPLREGALMPTSREVGALEALSSKWAIAPGATVVLGGVESKPELDGAAAVYVGEDVATGRSIVRLCVDERLLQVPGEKMRALPAGWDPATAAPKRDGEGAAAAPLPPPMARPRTAVPPTAAEVAELMRAFRNANA